MALPDNDALKELVYESLQELYANDRELITRKVYETATAHRLGVYMEQFWLSNGYDKRHVDIEYDKNMGNGKRLVPGEGGKRPDIIIHRRQSNDQNTLIVEMKKKKLSPIRDDENKLKGATDPRHGFHFQLGLYLGLRDDRYQCRWYVGGEMEQETLRIIPPVPAPGARAT